MFSCYKINRDIPVDRTKLIGMDYRTFQGTPAWELAKAVQDGNRKKIESIVSQNPGLINYQSPEFGLTLLHLTILNWQFKSFKILLENNADVSIHDSVTGASPLMHACDLQTFGKKYVELLIKYGANVNDVEVGPRKQGNSTRRTPLINAAITGSKSIVKLLVDRGADVNYKNEYGQTALTEAVMQRNYKIALYLLEHGADYTIPIFVRPGKSRPHRPEEDVPMYLVDVLREDFFDINSGEWKDKQKIISFLREHGVEYKDAPIPDYIVEKAKEKYPKNWQEYLEKY